MIFIIVKYFCSGNFDIPKIIGNILQNNVGTFFSKGTIEIFLHHTVEYPDTDLAHSYTCNQNETMVV